MRSRTVAIGTSVAVLGAIMVAMVSWSTDAPVPLGEFVPEADRRIVLHGVGWAGYQALLALRGERGSPRIAYLDGAVELMGASRKHESIKSNIGRLVEAYCTEHGIDWSPYGHWLLDDESEDAGAEPDECYIFGPDPKSKEIPDLVIEVIWTSGGINKREIYRRLGIREAWFWKRDVLAVFVLEGDQYIERDESECVPGIDLALLCRLAAVAPTSAAVAELREILRAAK